MGQLTTVLVLVLSISLIFLLTNVAIHNINPLGPSTFSCNGTSIGGLDANGCSGEFVLKDTNPQNFLPSGESSVSATTGNIFTDAFIAVKGWILDSTGLSYLIDLLSAPKWILLSIGVPAGFANIVGAFWWLVVLFLIVGWLLWGDK